MYLVEITKVFFIKNYILSKVYWKSNFIVQYYLKYFSNNLNSNYSNFFQSIRFLKQQKSILIVLKGRVLSQLFLQLYYFYVADTTSFQLIQHDIKSVSY